jgi:hypothetical protein
MSLGSQHKGSAVNLDRAIPLWFAFCISVSALVGAITPVGFQRALMSGAILGLLPLLLLWIVGLGVLLIFRDRPPCLCGSCRSQDYIFLSMDRRREQYTFDYECPSCHRRYRARDDLFFELATDGAEGPYMRRSKFGRWQPCS